MFQAKDICDEQKDFFWNYDSCECERRSLVARGAGEEPGGNWGNCGEYFSAIARRGNTVADIGSWILLGSCLALVAILAAATYHYRYYMNFYMKRYFVCLSLYLYAYCFLRTILLTIFVVGSKIYVKF